MKIIAKILIFGGLLILILNFSYPFYWEIKYYSERIAGVNYRILNPVIKSDIPDTNRIKTITPVDKDFGIVIPKIEANTKIYPNIDPFNPAEYLPVLKKGVAHAKGSSFPRQGKKIYLFAHSADNFYNVGKYNAVFYLLDKLQKNDEVDIFYKDNLYRYKVINKEIVSPSEIDYLNDENKEILILQTCYPPGTTLKRLIVTASPI